MIDGAKYCVFADAGHGPHLHYYKDLANAERMYDLLCAEYPEFYVDLTEWSGNKLIRWVKRNDGVDVETANRIVAEVTA